MSSFPLSISTGLAFEALFAPRQPRYDDSRPLPAVVKLSEYDSAYINVKTLFRNLIQSVSKETVQTAVPARIVDHLEQELEVIDSLFAVEGQRKVRPVFYLAHHKRLLDSLPPQVLLRLPATTTARHIAALQDQSLELLQRRHKQTGVLHVHPNEVEPSRRALMLTHTPVDLLNYKRFNQLHLLESNTGALKKRSQWYTKYYPLPDADMSVFPFTQALLLLLGDKTMFHPTLFKLREQLHACAVKHRWTSVSDEARVHDDLRREIKEPYVLEFIAKLRTNVHLS